MKVPPPSRFSPTQIPRSQPLSPPDPSPDRLDLRPQPPPEPQQPAAWKPLPQYPSMFGKGLGSTLAMALVGPVAVALSKGGEVLDRLGQEMGWWESLGSIKKPLPPNLLTPLPGARIERPILLVPGWQTPQDRFDHLAQKLTGGGANGGKVYFVKNGEFFADLDCTQRMLTRSADAKVFVAVFPDNNTPPDQTASELARSFKAIQDMTGSSKVDVTGYSMGGLATRLYLDQGGDAIGKFLMLGSPNQGSSLARSALGLLDLQQNGFNVSWLLSRKPLSESDRPALGWLRPVDGGSHNPQLSDLNSRWEQQKSRLEMVRILGSHSRPTLGRYFLPALGDGTVAGHALSIGKEEPVYLQNSNYRNHGLLFSNPDTYREMRSYFGWDG